MDDPEFTKEIAVGERLDYIFDWATYLARRGEAIASVNSVTGTANIVVESHSWDGVSQILFWAHPAGPNNVIALVTCSITTTGGRVASRSIQFLIRRR